MNLSIVVLTWNDWKSTIDCLQSIIKSNYKNYDVILVDNNSDSKHLNFIKKWQNKEILVIANLLHQVIKDLKNYRNQRK